MPAAEILQTPEIVYADQAIVVANKPAGLLSVPARGADRQDCLASRIQAEYDDALIVHRLDMETSGVIILARGTEMLRRMNLAFQERVIGKHYIALVHGHMDADAGEIDLPLSADPDKPPRQRVDHQAGRRALTRYRVAERSLAGDQPVSRVELKPVSGRTHQLRVHLMSIGHPIIGDPLYAPSGKGSARMHLHAAAIAFMHPQTRVPMRFECAVPF